MEEDQYPDVRVRFSASTSERVYVAVCVVVVIYLAILLAGCAAIFSLSTASDGNYLTGNFMIGEPHGNQTSEPANNETGFDSEGLD